MKKITKAKLLATALCITATFTSVNVMATETVPAPPASESSNSSIQISPFAYDVIEKRYKVINGRFCYRHFNLTRNKWVEDDWIIL